MSTVKTDEFYTEIYMPISRQVFEYPDLSEQATEEHKKELAKKEQKIIRKNSRSILFETVVAIGLIISVGMFFMLLINPQVGLAELAKDNSDLKDEIAVLKRNILDSEEDVNGITDMDSIRAQALALGMQDPNTNQVVSIPMPEDDKLVTMISYDEEFGISEEAYNNAVEALTNHYLEEASVDQSE